jgi:hypothetical protein
MSYEPRPLQLLTKACDIANAIMFGNRQRKRSIVVAEGDPMFAYTHLY